MRLFVFFFALIFGGLAHAQEPLSEWKLNDLITQCEVAQRTSKDPEPFADELLSRKGFNLGPDNRRRGADCLEHVYGYPFLFEGSRFRSVEAEKQMILAREAKERLQEKRKSDYLQALVLACQKKYFSDPFTALTTSACTDVFIQGGLPE